jgi:hypothetical protein
VNLHACQRASRIAPDVLRVEPTRIAFMVLGISDDMLRKVNGMEVLKRVGWI